MPKWAALMLVALALVVLTQLNGKTPSTAPPSTRNDAPPVGDIPFDALCCVPAATDALSAAALGASSEGLDAVVDGISEVMV